MCLVQIVAIVEDRSSDGVFAGMNVSGSRDRCSHCLCRASSGLSHLLALLEISFLITKKGIIISNLLEILRINSFLPIEW